MCLTAGADLTLRWGRHSGRERLRIIELGLHLSQRAQIYWLSFSTFCTPLSSFGFLPMNAREGNPFTSYTYIPTAKSLATVTLPHQVLPTLPVFDTRCFMRAPLCERILPSQKSVLSHPACVCMCACTIFTVAVLEAQSAGNGESIHALCPRRCSLQSNP